MSSREKILRIATGGILIALSTVLSFIRLFRLPMGGSVTAASLLPLVLAGFLFGPVWGVVIGAAHGLLQFLLSGEGALSIWSLLLDYPVAFGLIGLAGLFALSKQEREELPLQLRLAKLPLMKLILGTCVGILGRFVASFFSGIIFYYMYAGDMHPVLYSLLYNLSYNVPEIVITVLVLLLIRGALCYRKRQA